MGATVEEASLATLNMYYIYSTLKRIQKGPRSVDILVECLYYVSSTHRSASSIFILYDLFSYYILFRVLSYGRGRREIFAFFLRSLEDSDVRQVLSKIRVDLDHFHVPIKKMQKWEIGYRLSGKGTQN